MYIIKVIYNEGFHSSTKNGIHLQCRLVDLFVFVLL